MVLQSPVFVLNCFEVSAWELRGCGLGFRGYGLKTILCSLVWVCGLEYSSVRAWGLLLIEGFWIGAVLTENAAVSSSSYSGATTLNPKP